MRKRAKNRTGKQIIARCHFAKAKVIDGIIDVYWAFNICLLNRSPYNDRLYKWLEEKWFAHTYKGYDAELFGEVKFW